MTINGAIKLALENTVLCRGAHGAKESYEYAEKMESVIKNSIKETLRHALENTDDLETRIKEIIDDLGS
jgi:hypothetical protein